MKHLARCVHLQQVPGRLGTCALSIPLREVYAGGVGPCLTLDGRPDRRDACAHRVSVDQEVLDAEEREVKLALERFISGHCPECATPMEKREGDSVVVWVCPSHGGVARGCKRIWDGPA